MSLVGYSKTDEIGNMTTYKIRFYYAMEEDSGNLVDTQ